MKKLNLRVLFKNMGKKIKTPAVVAAVLKTEEEISETIKRKKENAKMYETQLKATNAKVLASLDIK
jgi:hypothetical protein